MVLRYHGLTIPSDPGKRCPHGLSPLARSVFDVVVMVVICFLNYLVSNWHSRSLGELRLATLIEDRASLLAQVAPLNILIDEHIHFTTTPAPVHTQLWHAYTYVTLWPPYHALSPPYDALASPFHILSSPFIAHLPPDLFSFCTHSRYHTICASRSMH
jgi:hypothetical protein